jgi:hypothetical protein
MQKHKLHKAVKNIIEKEIKGNYDDVEVIYDQACWTKNDSEKQNIPLFCSEHKSNYTEYCNVDILFLKAGKVRMIFEIDESNLLPTHVCGKFLASALSSYYIHASKDNKIIGMDENVSFIQVMDSSSIKEISSKTVQWGNIENSINKILPLKNSSVKNYKIIFGEAGSKVLEKEIINQMKKYL